MSVNSLPLLLLLTVCLCVVCQSTQIFQKMLSERGEELKLWYGGRHFILLCKVEFQLLGTSHRGGERRHGEHNDKNRGKIDEGYGKKPQISSREGGGVYPKIVTVESVLFLPHFCKKLFNRGGELSVVRQRPTETHHNSVQWTEKFLSPMGLKNGILL